MIRVARAASLSTQTGDVRCLKAEVAALLFRWTLPSSLGTLPFNQKHSLKVVVC